jgi:hypothetical protein
MTKLPSFETVEGRTTKSEAAVTKNLTVNELLGKAPPTTDENVIATYRGILEASAYAAADAAAELILEYQEQRDRGEKYQPDAKLVDEFEAASEALDRSWRGYVSRTNRAAAPIVSNAIEGHLGPDIAMFIEGSLEKLWKARYEVFDEHCRATGVYERIGAERVAAPSHEPDSAGPKIDR